MYYYSMNYPNKNYESTDSLIMWTRRKVLKNKKWKKRKLNSNSVQKMRFGVGYAYALSSSSRIFSRKKFFFAAVYNLPGSVCFCWSQEGENLGTLSLSAANTGWQTAPSLQLQSCTRVSPLQTGAYPSSSAHEVATQAPVCSILLTFSMNNLINNILYPFITICFIHRHFRYLNEKLFISCY